MLQKIRADLHIHSCLSPCAEVLNSPKRIVEKAKKKGIQIIALCDHNSVENCRAAIKAGRKIGVAVIPGMEITTREEVHILGWFPSVTAALEVQAKVYEALPGENDPERFGLQVIADEDDGVTDFCPKLLIGATTLSIEDVVRVIHRAEGLAVASHIDREGFGILGQLGFIPPDLKLDALEVSCDFPISEAHKRFVEYSSRFPILRNSDAHKLEDIGRGCTELECDEISYEGVKRSLSGLRGMVFS